MTTFSRPSTPAFSIYVPNVSNINLDFVYNHYVYDEGTNPIAGIPEIFKRRSIEQVNTNTTNFSFRAPRYVKLTWDIPPTNNPSAAPPNLLIKNNLEKVAAEDSFISSRFTSHQFSNFEDIENAHNFINDQYLVPGISQASAIDNYVSDLLSQYVETGDETDVEKLRNQITTAVENIEKIADRPLNNLGTNYSNDSGNQILDAAGFDQLVSNVPPLQAKVSSLVLPDVFVSASLSQNDITTINNFYIKGLQASSTNDDAIVKPVYVGEKSKNIENFFSGTSLIGYIIEKYELSSEGFVKIATFVIENISINSYIDLEVKYDTDYYYSIRTVAKIDVPGYDETNYEVRNLTYYICSNPVTNKIKCVEMVPPPPPVDINFVWDYKINKLKIVWGMPVNSQRDIKQFQIFRRSSINEPFELIRQKSFDYSTKKYVTGESIDGNRSDMSHEEAALVDYESRPSLMYVDEDFIADVEVFSSSKFIYTVASIDAHGMISNYGAQFEVTFDFFKNKIIKNLISNAGAPRQYPNMNLNVDLFKDVIKTDGMASTRMKIYFMPEYFKLKYNNEKVETMLATKEQNSFYKIQIINLQNQKSDSLKVTINDPYGLVK